jgi:hypothetical protein
MPRGRKKKAVYPVAKKPKTYDTFKEAWENEPELRRYTMAEGTLRKSSKLTSEDIARGNALLVKYGAKKHEVPPPPEAAPAL